MKYSNCLSWLSAALLLTTSVIGRTIRGSDEMEERFMQVVTSLQLQPPPAQQTCKPVRPHQTCLAQDTKPVCMPYRSTDYCPDDESFPILIQARTQRYRSAARQTYGNGHWFFTLEDKVAGYIFSAFEGFRAPEMKLCSDNINALDSYIFPPSEGIVIKATHLHSNKGVFVFAEGFKANGMATDIITNKQYSLADVKTVLAAANASTFVVEEYIPGEGLGRLPTEYKFHVINGKVVSINVVYNRESEHCGCWAEVDVNWNRLDKFGCFKPSGTAQPDGQCYAIDYAEGAADPYPMKGLNFCSDPLPKPELCQLQDMISIAERISLRVGAYIRVDMFVSVDNEIVVQEFTTNHANGLRHCSAVQHPSGCIDSCFMGRAWKEAGGNSLFGGPKTPVSVGIENWWKARNNVQSVCAVALTYKPLKWESSCPKKVNLAPNCARVTPESGGEANLTDVGAVSFVPNSFTEVATVCVNKTISSDLDALITTATRGKNVQDRMKYHVQVISDKPPVDGTISVVTVDVPDNIFDTLDNGATIEAYVLVDDDNNPRTPPVYKVFSGTLVAPPGTTDPKFVLRIPSTAYLPSDDGKSFVATVSLVAMSQINCGIVRTTGGKAMLQDVASVKFGPAVFTDDSEVCVTKTNEDSIQAIFDASTSQRNIQALLDYEVNVISQLKPINGSVGVTITLNVPDKLAANVALGASIVPFVLVDHNPDDPNLDFDQIAGTYDTNSKTITFDLPTTIFLSDIGDNNGKFTAVVTLAAMSPEGCDIIRPGGGTSDLAGVATATFGELAFSESSQVCIEKVEDPALVAKLNKDASGNNLQDTSTFAVNITSDLKPADSSSISFVVPQNLVQLTKSGASISAYVLLDDGKFKEIPATFNEAVGRASFVIPANSYLPNTDSDFEATVMIAVSSPPGCEILGPQGGTASTPNVGSVTFQAGALGANSEVCIKKIPSEINQGAFNKTIATTGLNVQEELPYDVQITADLPPSPETTNSVTLTVPPALLELVKIGADIIPFVLIDDDNDPSTPPVFMAPPAPTFDEETGTITFNLPAGAFFPPTAPGEPYTSTVTIAAVVDNNCEIITPSGGTASKEGVASASFEAGVFKQKSVVCINNGTDPYITSIFESSTSDMELAGPLTDQINITSQIKPERGTTTTVTVDIPADLASTVENGGKLTGFVLIGGVFRPVEGVFDKSTGKFVFDIPASAYVPDGSGGFTATFLVGSVLDKGCTIVGTDGGKAELEGVGSAAFKSGAFNEPTGVCIALGGAPGKILEEAISGLNVQDTLPQRVNITSENPPLQGTKATVSLVVSPDIDSAANSGATIQAMVLVETGDPANPLTYIVVNGTYDQSTKEFSFEVVNNAFIPNGAGEFVSTVTLITTAPLGCDIIGANGGTVDLDEVASATYTVGDFESDTQVCIYKSNLPSIQEIFDKSTTGFNIQTEMPYEVNIEADSRPKGQSTTRVSLAVKPEVSDDTEDGATIFAYVLTDSDNDPATPPVFVQVSGVYDAVSKMFSFDLKGTQYLPTPEGKFKAVVIVASSSPTGCEIIGPDGGSIVRPSVGSARLSATTFGEATEVCLLNGTDPVIDVLQENAKKEFALEGVLPYHVNLTANSQPSGGVRVQFNITVPDGLAEISASLGSSINAFVLFDDNDPTTPPKFRFVAGTYDPSTKSIVFFVPSTAFLPPTEPGGEWKIIATLGAVPLASSSPSVSQKPSNQGSTSPSLSHQPSSSPVPSSQPSGTPSKSPLPSKSPSIAPSSSPAPSGVPSVTPTRSPAPSAVPSYTPSKVASLSPSVSSYPSVSPTTNGCDTITANGGMVDFGNGNVTARFGKGVYRLDNEVCILITKEPAFQKIYEEAIPLFRPDGRLPYEVRILSESRPLKPHLVTVRVPPEFSAQANFTENIELFVLVNTDQGQTLQNLPSFYNTTTQTVLFELPPHVYLNAVSPNSDLGVFPFEAVFTLDITPGGPPTCEYPPCRRPTTNLTCEAASLRCPVNDGVGGSGCSNPINPFHGPVKGKLNLGIDYETKQGDRIVAAAAGLVEFVGPLTDYSGMSIIVRHSENSATLYAGMGDATVKVGDHVEADGVIGIASSAGLHFEYVPNGELYNTRARVNPAPCVGLIAEGSVLVGDNGNFADDSFEVIIDGVSIGQTPVGALGVNFGVSNLRPGRHNLMVHIKVAPDAFGTYYVRLNDGVYFVDENNQYIGIEVTKKVAPSNANEIPTCQPPKTGGFSNINPFDVIGCVYPAQSYDFYVPEEGEKKLTIAPSVAPKGRFLSFEKEVKLRGSTGVIIET